MKVSIALMRSLTDVKVPRRMAWRVMIPKKISETRFSQEPVHGREKVPVCGRVEVPASGQ
jgi:hypothetical protein